MTQEGKEKELLLQDLCARLYYKVKVQYKGAIKEVQYIEPEFDELCFIYPDNSFTVPVADCKPHLRSMSSMTEEEKKEYKHFIAFSGSPDGAANFVDWLNKKMFAYRTINGKDMFELGLAVEAPNGMYDRV